MRVTACPFKAAGCRLRGSEFQLARNKRRGNMKKAVGALAAIATVILGASMVAQHPAAPAPSAPVPAGLPDWAYTPPPPPGGPPAPSALPADDHAVVWIHGPRKA